MQALVWLLLATLPCAALHESDAGKIDWHKELVGIPRIESLEVAPKFERPAGRKRTSYLITVSEGNVLSAVAAADGKIVWRHALDADDPIGVYRSNPGFVVTLSGRGGAHLRSYDSTTGHLIFDSRLHKPDEGITFGPNNVGQDMMLAVDKTPDVFALTNAHTLRRIDGLSGETKWTWASDDPSSSVVFHKIVATEATVYLIGLTRSSKAHTLHVVALDSSTGAILSSVDVPSSVNRASDFIALTSSRSPHPILAWLQESHIKTIVLSAPKLNVTPRTIREYTYQELKDVGIADAGLFVALKRDGTCHIIRIDHTVQGVRNVWELDSTIPLDRVGMLYSGGVDKEGRPYIALTSWSESMQVAELQLFAANGAEGAGMTTGFTFPFDRASHGSIRHFALEVANPEPNVFVARGMFTTSAGTLQLWQQDVVKWTREESLTKIQNVEFIDLPEKKVVGDGLNGQNFLSRFLRQIGDTRDFPAYAASFGRRFLTGSSTSPGSVSQDGGGGPLWRDTFGFRKLLVISTTTGKVFGIDTVGGNIVWSRLLVPRSKDGTVKPFKLFPVATVSDGRLPEIVLFAHSQSSEGDISTVFYHFEALTGLNLRNVHRQPEIMTGVWAFEGTIADAYLLRGENKTIVVIGDDQEVRLYPDDPSVRASFARSAPSIRLALENTTQRLSGYQIIPNPEEGTFNLSTRWSHLLEPSERIQKVIRRPQEPVASPGKLLGDRSMVFKYLNPHVIGVLTSSTTVPPRCGLYLLDGATSTALYHAFVPPAGGVCTTQATFTQNWLVYYYYDESLNGPNGVKGHRLVSVELYEGTGSEDQSPDTSYTPRPPVVFQQTYVYPYGITTIATTSTKFGISTKDLIVANTKEQIQLIPRRFLDPRRPKRKPTVEEQRVEWLMQYEPLIPDDPRLVISHRYKVVGTKKIVTSPGLLESTSIVLTYGLDLFLTRVAPSNTFDLLSESFNKFQLVLTVVALGVAYFVTKPIVRRKQMRQRWYYS